MKTKIFNLRIYLIWIARNWRILLSSTPKIPLTIISASDYSHEKSLLNLLISINKFEKDARIVVYDLGLSTEIESKLKSDFSNVEFRVFPFDRYPDFYNIRVNAGNYAWKSAIIDAMISENPSYILWMDAGNIITGKLKLIRKIIRRFGFYSPYSDGILQDWTHPLALKRMGVNRDLMFVRNLGANVIGFDASNQRALKVIKDWVSSCSQKNLISPETSSRENHRQDQSLLTILAYRGGIVGYKSLGDFPRRAFKILVHQDVE
jgi:hypothetical protein